MHNDSVCETLINDEEKVSSDFSYIITYNEHIYCININYYISKQTNKYTYV